MKKLCIGLLSLAQLVLSIPGDFDTSFNGTGKNTFHIGGGNNAIHAIALQPDGKIVTAGVAHNSFSLARYKLDGTLDTNSFGIPHGYVVTAVGTENSNAHAVAMQSDGKIVVAGIADDTFAVARYKQDGTLDTEGFAAPYGWIKTAVGTGCSGARSMGIQSDGKIVVAGFSQNQCAIARYTLDGKLDTKTFGSPHGYVVSSFGVGTSTIQAIAIQPDDKIVAVGSVSNGTTMNFLVARYNIDGSLDTEEFCTPNGYSITPIGSGTACATAVTVQDDGKIIVAGYTSNACNYFDFVVACYSQEGILNSGEFGPDGYVTTSMGNVYQDDPSLSCGNGCAQAVAIQRTAEEDKIILAGYAENRDHFSFAIARYNSQGVLDNTFHHTGKTMMPLTTGKNDRGYAMAIQSDEKIIVGGSAFNGTTTDFAIARYLTTGPTARSITTRTHNAEPITITLHGNEPKLHALHFVISQKPQYGKLSDIVHVTNSSATIMYTPLQNMEGLTDTFTYYTQDGDLQSLHATVTIQGIRGS